MAKKRNQELRPAIDARKRKRVNGSRAWEERMMDELINGEPEEEPSVKRKKKAREQARRLTSTSL